MKLKINHLTRLIVMAVLALGGISAAMAGTEVSQRLYDSTSLSVGTLTGGDGNEYCNIQWDGMNSTSEVGAPMLPVEYIRFIVPVYTSNFRATVNNVGRTAVRTLAHDLYPVQEPVKTSSEAPVVFTAPDPAAYTTPYSIRAEVIDDGFIDGCNHIVTVAVYPVGYDATAGRLSIASSLTVNLEYDQCTASQLKDNPILPTNPTYTLNISNIIDNTPKFKAASTVPIYPYLSPTRYYIITSKNLKEAFADLVLWKKQKGYTVVVTTTESIYNTDKYRIGQISKIGNHEELIVDSAASVRAYLADEFQKYGMYYCLLAGDYRTSVPIRRVCDKKVSNAIPNSADFSPTDNYFSDLTTNWNLTNAYGGIYSAPSHKTFYPDIILSRLLCSEPKHIENYAKKLIIYEASPGYGNDEYLSKALIFNHNDGLATAYKPDETFDGLEKILTVNDSCKFGNVTIPHTGSDMIKLMSDKGFISFNTHGSPVGFSTCKKHKKGIIAINSYRNGYELGPTIQDDPNDPNRGIDCMGNYNHPNVLYSISCDVIPFDAWCCIDESENYYALYDMEYNIAQAYTVAGLYGGVGFLGNTRSGYFGSSNKMEAIWCAELLKNPQIGYAETMSKAFFQGDNSIVSRHHLIGEPEFEMWLAKPKRMNVNFSYSTEGISLYSSALSNASIIYYDGIQTSYKLTADSENFTLTSPSFANEYTIAIWKTGFLPIIKFATRNGQLSNSKSFFATNAVIGEQNALSTDSNNVYTISAGGVLSLSVIGNTIVSNNVTIEEGGCLEIDCINNVYLNCTVKKGGKLKITAKNVQFDNKFFVNKGGIVEINQK